MTNIPTSLTFSPGFAAYEQQARDRAALEAKTRPANKTALFDALARIGLAQVVVAFDGAGDSGQIESIEATGADQVPVALLDERIPIAKSLCDGSGVESTDLTLTEAVETLAYDFLEETHGGWEDNEGAYGEFSFDVAARTIRLEYNERVMETEFSEHEF